MWTCLRTVLPARTCHVIRQHRNRLPLKTSIEHSLQAGIPRLVYSDNIRYRWLLAVPSDRYTWTIINYCVAGARSRGSSVNVTRIKGTGQYARTGDVYLCRVRQSCGHPNRSIGVECTIWSACLACTPVVAIPALEQRDFYGFSKLTRELCTTGVL